MYCTHSVNSKSRKLVFILQRFSKLDMNNTVQHTLNCFTVQNKLIIFKKNLFLCLSNKIWLVMLKMLLRKQWYCKYGNSIAAYFTICLKLLNKFYILNLYIKFINLDLHLLYKIPNRILAKQFSIKWKRVAFSWLATKIIEWPVTSLFCILFIVLRCLLTVLISALFES